MVIRTCVLAVVLVAGALGAEPVTRPVKPLDGVKDVAASIPKDLWPDGRGWTELQARAANDWAKREIVGRIIRVRGVVESVDVSDGVHIAVKPEDFKVRGQAVKGTASLTFGDAVPGQLARLRPGDRIAANGTIGQVGLSIGNPYGNFSGVLMIGVGVTDATLER